MGRQDAPSPNSGFEIGKKLGTDKGHLMALQLGGPDVSENIVPQPSEWQASGCWRELEKGIHDLAVAMIKPVRWGIVSEDDRISGYGPQKKMIRKAFQEHLRY
ncbi:DNA/RNA non-specific endonuclease [Sorangium sp. So ce136]|uniref:DNA/RNA non-specific endonuclease n=1 Tax=Sorangium sp. So ce136 TaxID=3133284 RepID=UPI003F0F3056